MARGDDILDLAAVAARGYWYGTPTARAPAPVPAPQVMPPPLVAPGTPPLAPALGPIDPAQLAAVLYDKTIPIGFSTRAQWGGRIIEGPVFGVVNNETVVSFIAGYFIPINFWDTTRTVSELYFRGQLAWTLGGGASMSGLHVGVPTVNGLATVRFNTGTLAQTADAWSISRYGADRAVAYVPLVTATFENIRLAQFNNTVPFTSVTVEDTAYGDPGDLVAWADAIEALAQYDGRGPDEFSTVDVSGGLNALILGSKLTFTDFLAAMRKHKPQWNVRTTDRLYLVEKGVFSLDLTLEQAKLVSHGAQPIVLHSSDAFDKPREKIAHYLDVDRDYEPSNARVAEDIDPVIVTDSFDTDSYDLPVASTASVIMNELSFAYYTGEVSRQKSEFSGMAHYLGLEPGDCYEWTSASGRVLHHRVNEIVRRADFTVDAKGEGFLNCAIVGEPGPGPGPEPPPDLTTFSTWNPADLEDISLTGGNLTATGSGAVENGVRATGGASSRKYYFEVTVSTWTNGATAVGITLATVSSYFSPGNIGAAALSKSGLVLINGAGTGPSGSIGARASGDTIGVAVDLDSKLIRFNVVPSGPSTGWLNIAPIGGGLLFPTFWSFVLGDAATANFGASAFAGTVPAGFAPGWPA